MKRCVVNCGLCKVSKEPHEPNVFCVKRPLAKYTWCVYRHSEPLERGVYEVMVKDNGQISGTVCYRSRIVPKTVFKRRGGSGGVL